MVDGFVKLDQGVFSADQQKQIPGTKVLTNNMLMIWRMTDQWQIERGR